VRAQLRYAGSDTALEVKSAGLAAMRRAFEAAHKARFGFIDPSKDLVIEAVNVEAVGGAARFLEPRGRNRPAQLPKPERATRLFLERAMAQGARLLTRSLRLARG